MGNAVAADQEQPDEWIIACWITRPYLSLLPVPRIEGVIRPDVCSHIWASEPATWRTYHAARKYQREHEEELKGYVVCNLSEIYRLAEVTRLRN